MPRHIAITGATGLIGSALSQALVARGDHVVAFTRSPLQQGTLPATAQRVQWDPRDTHATATALRGCDTIVNLVGASIAGKRWTPAYKQTLVTSRVDATQQLLTAVAQMTKPPTTLISSSGAGYYGINAVANHEDTAPGTDFLATLCIDWESAIASAHALGIRSVVVRTGVVLDSTSGALPLMALPFRFFVGGPVLPGTQMISWIHITDMVQLLLWAIDNPQANGVYNACAPHPVTNHTLSTAIARRLQRPSWLPVPQFALRLLFGEMADALLIGGQAVTSARLPSAGFTFRHATIDEALANLW
ncbi:MAG: TIGR01777 family protein [Chloroflexia bacterium]|nr:TIGR01777 family protein [Chloroflexia bacterium]